MFLPLAQPVGRAGPGEEVSLLVPAPVVSGALRAELRLLGQVKQFGNEEDCATQER